MQQMDYIPLRQVEDQRGGEKFEKEGFGLGKEGFNREWK